MVDSLGFFTSRYKDPNSSINSLGGEVYSRISEDLLGQIFSPVNEYNSTNRSVDYRVIYVKNISRKQGVIVNSPVVSVDHMYVNKQEVFKLQDLYRVRINLFAPLNYISVNSTHPKIFTNGEFVEQQEFVSDFILENSNPRYYGRSILLDEINLKTNDFFPLILERVITSPVPFVNKFSFKITAKYTITME